MKAASKFLSAVSAIALSTTPVVGGAVALQVLTTSVANAAVVNSISISGNQRVANATIADFVGYKAGKNFTAASVDAAIKALFRTGLFSDVSVTTSGSTLVVNVSEYSTVNQVLFQGNKKLKDNRLSAVVQLKSRSRFDQATLDADVDAIVQAYSRIGRADVSVNASVVDLGENRVNVVFQIAEGGKTKISNINFTGNNAFGDRRLQGIISTKRTNFMSWLSRNDVYDEQRLAADEETIRRFYFNRGYADFRMLSSSVDADPETGNLTINFEVDEGERYAFGNIDVDSTVTGVESSALSSSVKTSSGATYSAKDVEDSLIAISEKLAANGFPFAEVTPVGNRNFENNTIDVSYVVDQGQRAYIERIEIVGNTATRDYVIRREFDLSEGDAFNQILIRRAQKRLEALDFFSRVQITTRPGTASDRVIVVVQVEDKSTGEFGFGVGYTTGSTDDSGVNLEASIEQRNFQGRGQALKLAVGGTTSSRTYNVSFTEPYFLGYRLSATGRAFRSTNSYDSEGYKTASTGGSISFGLPINDALTGIFGYSLTQDELTVTDAVKSSPAVDAAALGYPRLKSAINYGFIYNTVDDRQDPHEGVYLRIDQEVAGLGGDARYIKTTAEGRYFQTLSEDADIVGMIKLGGGNITGLGQKVSLLDHFRVGPSRIRGFANNGIGPTDGSGYHIGGKNYLNATAEVQFPLPALPRDLGFKGAFFADAATLWGSDEATADATTTGMKIRSSAGVSIIWQSPFAPLRLDYAWPIQKEATDKVTKWNFSVSSAF